MEIWVTLKKRERERKEKALSLLTAYPTVSKLAEMSKVGTYERQALENFDGGKRGPALSSL